MEEILGQKKFIKLKQEKLYHLNHQLTYLERLIYSVEKLINISKLAIELDLINPKNKKPLNYVLRYWEKQFSQIKPKIINKRRYYSKEQVEIFKLIKYFLKNQGLTINGVKNILNTKNTKQILEQRL